MYVRTRKPHGRPCVSLLHNHNVLRAKSPRVTVSCRGRTNLAPLSTRLKNCRNESCAGADANLFCSAPHKSTRIRFQCLVQTYTGEATGEWCDRTRQICPSFHTLLCHSQTNSSLQHAQEKNVCLTCVSHVIRPPFCSRWGGERIACLRWHGPCGIDGARLQQTSRGSHAPKLYVHPASSIWQTGSHCDTGLLALLSFMFEQYKCSFGWSCLERRAFEAGITERVPAFPHTRRSLPVKKEPCTWQQYALQTIVAIVSSEVR